MLSLGRRPRCSFGVAEQGIELATYDAVATMIVSLPVALGVVQAFTPTLGAVTVFAQSLGMAVQFVAPLSAVVSLVVAASTVTAFNTTLVVCLEVHDG